MNAKISSLRDSKHLALMALLALCLAIPLRAVAGGAAPAAPAPSPTSDRSPDAGVRAGADAWFEEYIQPTLQSSPDRFEASERSPVLYDPLESRPPGGPTCGPPGASCRHRAQVGSLGTIVLATDSEPPRGDWSETLQPEMFRLYFEPLPEPPKPQPGPVPGA
jgi:hypothetical protein